MTDTTDWLSEAVAYFRRLDFFQQHHNLSDAELANHLDARYKEWAGRSLNEIAAEVALQVAADKVRSEAGRKGEWDFDMPPAMADITLVALDTNRIWWDDGEMDIRPGDDTYIKALQEWSRISRGAFEPENIKETWVDADGPMDIGFMLHGVQHRLVPEQAFGWLDFGLLGQVNRLIEASGFQYYDVDKEVDQTTCIVVLTLEEVEKLERERDWALEILTEEYGSQ